MEPELSGRRGAAGSTRAVQALQQAGVDFAEHPYEHDPDAASFGLEAAEALGVDPGSVFKTLVALADGRWVVAVVPVSSNLDLKLLARTVGTKRATMAEAARAEKVTGYVTGGISPFGQRNRLTTVIDDSALDLAWVYVSGGKRGFDVSVRPGDLVALTEATVAAIRC